MRTRPPSLGELFAATVLCRIGWQADVYERSARELDSRGGGMVLQPDLVELLRTVGAAIDGVGDDAELVREGSRTGDHLMFHRVAGRLAG